MLPIGKNQQLPSLVPLGGRENRQAQNSKLKTQMKELQAIEIQLNESPDKQVSLTDPDSGSIMTRGTGIVGYNVQTVVDTQHHLIVAHEVTNFGSDRDQRISPPNSTPESSKRGKNYWP